MPIVSAIDVYTVKDEAGNPRTTGWFEVEFRENYVAGGIGVNLSPYFRVIRDVFPRFVSGALHYFPEVDPSAMDPASTRIQLTWIGSGLVASGFCTIASGQPLISGVWYTPLLSGNVHLGHVAPPRAFNEIDDGTPVSGVRTRLLALGF